MINAEVLIESTRWKKIVRNPKRQIKDILDKFPTRYKFIKKKVSITILLTNNKNIKLLNKKFRKKDQPTDILSLMSNNETAMVLLRIIEIIGEDSVASLDSDTLYFIISILNNLDLDNIRNKIILKTLPLKL